MQDKQCEFRSPFGSDVSDFGQAFSDPAGDARRLFESNGKYNLILAQSEGVWDVYYENGEYSQDDISGITKFKDPKYEEEMVLVSSPNEYLPPNTINILEEADVRRPLDLIGTRAENPSECYDHLAIQAYVRKFNRTSLDLVADKLKQRQLR